MCGIVGIASTSAVAQRQWLARGRDTLHHRGPDDAGEWWLADGRVGLGHRRLAVIDLSAAAHQPMLARDGAACIVFNGEIYNFQELRASLMALGHAFQTRSDTEVILAAWRQWGSECVERLHGMFAFALFDLPSRQLLLARDRAGEKPLFYRLDGGTLRFASELKALLADPQVPRLLDREALDCLLLDGFVTGEQCILQGFNKLPAAHALSFDLDTGRIRRWRYWRPPPLTPEAEAGTLSADLLVDELYTLLQAAVTQQLVADVPVGVLLSGGVDSSLVTAVAARQVNRLKTFTVRFPGDGRFDETEHARLIARHFGTEHMELEAEPSTIDALPLLARQFDEPLVDSSMLPTWLVTRLVRRHCTVALGGDGGDELFGGYTHYDRLLRLHAHSRWVPQSLRGMVARAAARHLEPGTRGRNWLQVLDTDWKRSVPVVASLFDLELRRRLLAGQAGWPWVAELRRALRMPVAGDLVQRMTRLDFQYYMVEDILCKVDRASMLNSLEVRSPLLDTSVLNFAFGRVPSRYKTTQHDRKILLKRLTARLLPAEFDRERKQGFSVPINRWVRSGPWRDYFREVLLAPEQRLFDHGFVEQLIAGNARGRFNGERLFGLVMIELWRREYRIDVGA